MDLSCNKNKSDILNTRFDYIRLKTNRSVHMPRLLKNLDSIDQTIISKKKMLKEQSIIRNRASLNLKSHLVFNTIIKEQIFQNKNLEALRNKSATLIQKVSRGYLSRLKNTNFTLNIKKKILNTMISELHSTTDNLFLGSESTKKVIYK